jgi:hypothetical protein
MTRVLAGQRAVRSPIVDSDGDRGLPGAKWGASRLIHVLPKAADGHLGLPAQKRRCHAELVPSRASEATTSVESPNIRGSRRSGGWAAPGTDQPVLDPKGLAFLVAGTRGALATMLGACAIFGTANAGDVAGVCAGCARPAPTAVAGGRAGAGLLAKTLRCPRRTGERNRRGVTERGLRGDRPDLREAR